MGNVSFESYVAVVPLLATEIMFAEKLGLRPEQLYSIKMGFDKFRSVSFKFANQIDINTLILKDRTEFTFERVYTMSEAIFA